MKLWLFRISLGHLREYPGRTLLGILGIALGTAVYLSISLAADSAVRSFQAGVTAVAGKAQWRVQSPGAPLDESLYPRLRHLPGVRAAAPVVESVLELSGPHPGPVLLLGIDPFSEKDFRDYEFEPGSRPGPAGLGRFSHPSGRRPGERPPGGPAAVAGGGFPAGVGGSGPEESGGYRDFSLGQRPLPLGRRGSPDGYRGGPGTPGPGGTPGLYRPHYPR